MRVADLLGGGATTYRMTKVATVPGAPFGYDFWEAKFKAPEVLTVLGYTFGAVDGAKIVYYEDDAAQDGGVGQPYNAPANRPYNIYVYDAAFTDAGVGQERGHLPDLPRPLPQRRCDQ